MAGHLHSFNSREHGSEERLGHGNRDAPWPDWSLPWRQIAEIDEELADIDRFMRPRSSEKPRTTIARSVGTLFGGREFFQDATERFAELRNQRAVLQRQAIALRADVFRRDAVIRSYIQAIVHLRAGARR